MSWANVASILPLTITHNGEPVAFIGSKEDFMYVGDLHIRVRNSLRALEAKARAGMQKPTQVHVEDLEPDVVVKQKTGR